MGDKPVHRKILYLPSMLACVKQRLLWIVWGQNTYLFISQAPSWDCHAWRTSDATSDQHTLRIQKNGPGCIQKTRHALLCLQCQRCCCVGGSWHIKGWIRGPGEDSAVKFERRNSWILVRYSKSTSDKVGRVYTTYPVIIMPLYMFLCV